MNYQQAMEYLISSYGVGKKRGMDAVRRVLHELSDPQQNIRVIHVAGTNGKGSVCAMLSRILQDEGYRTGLYTSPHLESFLERFKVNGFEISEEQFAEGMSAVRAAQAAAFGNRIDCLSYFELLTVLCFWYFDRARVDFLVLETGIGGRLDSTNVIEVPVLSVITSVDLDHTEFLGGTRDEIAREKAGIIKKNSRAVLYYGADSVYNVFKEVTCRMNATLYRVKNREILNISAGLDGTVFDVKTDLFAYKGLKLSLIGEFQTQNALTALTAVHALQAAGVRLTEAAVRSGLASASWPGRMEAVNMKPLIILDGAHNMEGAESLAASVKSLFMRGLEGIRSKIVLLTGILRDKDYSEMVGLLAGLADEVILTRPNYDARALEPKHLYRGLEAEYKVVIAEGNYRRAFELALSRAGGDGVLLVAGSLYLIGDIRILCREKGLLCKIN